MGLRSTLSGPEEPRRAGQTSPCHDVVDCIIDQEILHFPLDMNKSDKGIGTVLRRHSVRIDEPTLEQQNGLRDKTMDTNGQWTAPESLEEYEEHEDLESMYYMY